MDVSVKTRRHLCARCGLETAEDRTTCDACGGPVVALGTERDDLSGRVLGAKFRLVERIGRGGMGDVYLAEQQNLRRQVAVKVLPLGHVNRAEALRRFYAEAQLTSLLSHPHNIKVHDFGHTEDGFVFIVMEHVRGELLSALPTPMQTERALALMIQVCSALAEAHALGIVHRDLKPANIMVSQVDGRDFVRLLDYGIAKSMDASVSLTDSSRLLGTPEYMSPEQASGSHVDARADIYALGCILYTLVTGRPPFAGDNPMNLVYKHQNERPISPRRLAPVSREVERVIVACLAKRAADRPQSATDLRQLLESARLTVAKSPAGLGASTPEDGAPDPPLPEEDTPGRPVPDREIPDTLDHTPAERPAPMVAARAAPAGSPLRVWAVAVGIGLVGVVVLALWQGRPPYEPAPSAPVALPTAVGEPVDPLRSAEPTEPGAEPPGSGSDRSAAARSLTLALARSTLWATLAAARPSGPVVVDEVGSNRDAPAEPREVAGQGGAAGETDAPRRVEAAPRADATPRIEPGDPPASPPDITPDAARQRARDATRSLLDDVPSPRPDRATPDLTAPDQRP